MNNAQHPLKVLIICLTRRGGLLQFNDCLVENLTQFCEVGVITTEGAEHAQMNWDQHVAYSRLIDMGQGKKGTFNKLFSRNSWKVFKRALDEFKPDLIHFTAAQEWNPALGIYLKMFQKLPIIYTIHDVVHHEGAPLYFQITESIFRKIPSYFIVLTEQGKNILVKQGKPANHVMVVPHGVYDFFTQYAQADLTQENEILFFGRIEPYKGLDILLKAAQGVLSRHPDWVLRIAGGGDISPYEKELANERIFVTNRFLSNEEVADYMQRAAIVALPYISASQSGVIPTAFAFKKPVIATRVGGIPEMIDDGKTGILIPPNDVQALENALERLIANPELRGILGENGCEFALEELGWHAIAKKHYTFYQNILQQTK